jgi:hypothetical protein
MELERSYIGLGPMWLLSVSTCHLFATESFNMLESPFGPAVQRSSDRLLLGNQGAINASHVDRPRREPEDFKGLHNRGGNVSHRIMSELRLISHSDARLSNMQSVNLGVL